MTVALVSKQNKPARVIISFGSIKEHEACIYFLHSRHGKQLSWTKFRHDIMKGQDNCESLAAKFVDLKRPEYDKNAR